MMPIRLVWRYSADNRGVGEMEVYDRVTGRQWAHVKRVERQPGSTEAEIELEDGTCFVSDDVQYEEAPL